MVTIVLRKFASCLYSQSSLSRLLCVLCGSVVISQSKIREFTAEPQSTQGKREREPLSKGNMLNWYPLNIYQTNAAHAEENRIYALGRCSSWHGTR